VSNQSIFSQELQPRKKRMTCGRKAIISGVVKVVSLPNFGRSNHSDIITITSMKETIQQYLSHISAITTSSE
jgi:hypothetical protein